jgi:hypothetical protein
MAVLRSYGGLLVVVDFLRPAARPLDDGNNACRRRFSDGCFSGESRGSTFGYGRSRLAQPAIGRHFVFEELIMQPGPSCIRCGCSGSPWRDLGCLKMMIPFGGLHVMELDIGFSSSSPISIAWLRSGLSSRLTSSAIALRP